MERQTDRLIDTYLSKHIRTMAEHLSFPIIPSPICWSSVTSFFHLLVGCSSLSCWLDTHSSYLQILFSKALPLFFQSKHGWLWLEMTVFLTNCMVCHFQNPRKRYEKGRAIARLLGAPPACHSHSLCFIILSRLAHSSQAVWDIRKLHTLRWRAVSWHHGHSGWGSPIIRPQLGAGGERWRKK